MDKSQKYRLKDLEGYREKKREYAKTDAQKEKRKIYMRRWRAKNKDKSNQARKDYHYRNRDMVNALQKVRMLKRKYGLTVEQFDRMAEAQGGRCKLCGKIPKISKIRGLHVDHSHTTGEVRALLCVSCNTVLGRIESIGIARFEAYINEFRE
jgi:hypothetical protein